MTLNTANINNSKVQCLLINNKCIHNIDTAARNKNTTLMQFQL
ncbi:hypothetical protein PAUR_a3127 [Pseudoalteromonas aurantia 208]|uniref:Orphan protein n=1 Tax=Pseudoalteromonas aurantia 208 TaxID=1314867 RepID=A0ABR9EE92_9GAMM|nr:hypothetical protein [Pseudoalteromonas aurantia 208]